MVLRPIRLEPSFREKIWGTTELHPWFPRADQKIGEVWFSFDDNTTSAGLRLGELMREHGADLLGTEVPESRGGGPGGRFPILLKFIFTSDRLSVQVHPGDEYALAHESSSGKTEMWHILRADAGAQIALGFRSRLSADRLREACLTGEVEHLLNWIEVKTGDTFFAPAGTVHAIGAGIALCEIQQNSDLTYRLYDYGRPRELHLEKSLAVSDAGPHPGRSEPRGNVLASCRYFATETLDAAEAVQYRPDERRFHLLAAIEGSGRLGDESFQAGHVWLIPATAGSFDIVPDGRARFLKCYVP